MEFLFTPGQHNSFAILSILVIVFIKVFIFYSARTRFWTFSQFFFFSLENIELTEGPRYVVKLVNNVLTCSIIFIIFSYFLLFYSNNTVETPVATIVAEASFEPVIESNPEIFNSISTNNPASYLTSGKQVETDDIERSNLADMESVPTISNKAENASNKNVIKAIDVTASNKSVVEIKNKVYAIRVNEKRRRRLVKTISKALPVINKRNFSSTEMFLILGLLKEKREQLSINSNCVRIIKSKTSNIENAFHLAQFFQKHGFVIAGREERSIKETGVRIDVEGIIFKIIIGKN